jgi:hypothetical protein
MSAFGGEFNESTQHLLILADEEVCEWRGMHGPGSRRNRRLSCGSAGRAVNVWRTTAAGVACDVVQVEHEHPYEAIIDTAKKRGCDAIVMASHGRRGVVLGSETVKVLTHSTMPVVVVRG